MRLLIVAILSGLIFVFSSVKDASAQAIEMIEFVPDAITRLCPDHRGGDREFNGHGPNVTAHADMEIKLNTELWVKLYLHVKETRADWTEAEHTWDRQLWTAPSGYVILGVASDMDSNAFYEDSNHELDRPAVRGGDLVRQFEILGDTGGDDVSNCTDDDVYMNVYFNKVNVVVQRANTVQIPVSRPVVSRPVGTTLGAVRTFESGPGAAALVPDNEKAILKSGAGVRPDIPAEVNGEKAQLDNGSYNQSGATGEKVQPDDGSGDRFNTLPDVNLTPGEADEDAESQ